MSVPTPRGTNRAARDSPSEDEVMDARFNMSGNQIAARFANRLASASLVIAQSPLPQPAQSRCRCPPARSTAAAGASTCPPRRPQPPVKPRPGSTWSPPGASPPWSPRPSGPALALAEKGTRLADARHGVSDQTWAQVRKRYADDQIAALVCLVALMNAASRLAVIVHQQGAPTSPPCSPPRSTDRQATPA